jgi:predicted GIY-YIG superfamily endonuclease
MLYVYYLRSVNFPDKFYVGFSSDLKGRIKKHNQGDVASTKPFKPWKLIFYESFLNRKDAIRREGYLKTTRGRRALKLMLRDYLVSEASKS